MGEKKFSEIADRFAKIPSEKIEPARPEIAFPVLEALDHTQDNNLRALFIELLASASQAESAWTCHPSFVQIIKQIASQEAVLLQHWSDKVQIPFVEVCQRIGKSSQRHISEIYDLPDDFENPQYIPAFLDNLTGMGILSKTTSQWLTGGQYDELRTHAERTWPGITGSLMQSEDIEMEEGIVFYNKGIITISSYGRLFQQSCLPNSLS